MFIFTTSTFLVSYKPVSYKYRLSAIPIPGQFENDTSLTFRLSSASLHLTSAGAGLIGDSVIVGGLFTAGFIIISKRFNIFAESSEGRINVLRFDYPDF